MPFLDCRFSGKLRDGSVRKHGTDSRGCMRIDFISAHPASYPYDPWLIFHEVVVKWPRLRCLRTHRAGPSLEVPSLFPIPDFAFVYSLEVFMPTPTPRVSVR